MDRLNRAEANRNTTSTPTLFFLLSQVGAAAVPGTLHVVNSLDRFKAFDWGGALGAAAAAIWAAAGGEAADGGSEDALLPLLPSPLPLASALARFILVVHADLKTHQYTYWAAFPAVKPPAALAGAPPRPLDEALGASAAAAVAAAATRLLRPQGGGDGDEDTPPSPPPPAFCVTLGDDGTAAASPLADLFCAPPPSTRRLLAFWDTAASPSAPGWPLRNLLLAAAARAPPQLGARRVLIGALRARRGVVDAAASLALDVSLPPTPPGWPPASSPPPAVGWEVGPRGGRPGPRRADVGAALDARRVAVDAVALNLRLMRWRAATDLDPGTVSRASFLLIGAGTLGCAAARCLLGWGVTKITFVDAGTVSHSNPARQSLYTVDDAVARAPKAVTAAAALARVTPGADTARGVSLEVPLPGHPPATADEEAAIRTAIATLATEVAAADVVMLLTDTRESRWLPTLLAAAAAADAADARRPPPLAITAAIGFDTYVVMRHGVPQQEEDESGGGCTSGDHATHITPPTRLGCYFCADVVAPTDSTRDRALDQQCTVSRPGLAPLAASLAVEVAAAALVHPRGAAAPPPGVHPADDAAAPLGPVPHQLRGRLGGGFASGALVGGAARQCVACSRAAVAAWRSRGADFVLAAARDPASLERETGLDELHAAAEEMVAAAEGGGGGGDDDDGDEWLEL